MGAAALGIARLIPRLLSPLAFWLLLAALVAALGTGQLAWHLCGVRAAELDGDALTLRRGRGALRIDRGAVLGVRKRRGGRLLVVSARGVRGRRFRVPLSDEAFDPAEFAALAGRLCSWTGADDAPAGGSRSSSSRG